ncbi:MAG: hypothetical protein ACOYMN_10970, partial [Roseimicrobium sp.]
MMPDAERQRIARIFRHLQALDETRNPVARHVKEHTSAIWWRDCPSHPAIVMGDSSEPVELEGEGFGALLTVTTATTPCPAPPEVIEGWLKVGWSDADGHVETLSEKEVENANRVFERKFFHDDPERLSALEDWLAKRDEWAKAELAVRKLRERLTEILTELELEGERVDLVV